MKGTHWGAALLCAVVGCGGAQPVAETETDTAAETETVSETETETATETESGAETETVAETETESETEIDSETEAEEEEEEAEEEVAEAAPAEPPLTSPTAETLEAAILAAATDRLAFRRLVDPAWGVGVFDPAEAGIHQYCEMRNIANNPGLGFVFNHGDEFSCNRELSRCTVKDDSRAGYAFFFREGEGDTVFLNAIVHYPQRIPNREGSAARTFVRGGDGVCGVHEAVRSADAAPPSQLSVFVSEQTGLVPEALTEHHCGDDAAAAFSERLGTMRHRRPRECNRNPARCVWRSGDEDYTVYATDEGAPYAIAITRFGMHEDLARTQARAVDAFLRDAAQQGCE